MVLEVALVLDSTRRFPREQAGRSLMALLLRITGSPDNQGSEEIQMCPSTAGPGQPLLLQHAPV